MGYLARKAICGDVDLMFLLLHTRGDSGSNCGCDRTLPSHLHLPLSSADLPGRRCCLLAVQDVNQLNSASWSPWPLGHEPLPCLESPSSSGVEGYVAERCLLMLEHSGFGVHRHGMALKKWTTGDLACGLGEGWSVV